MTRPSKICGGKAFALLVVAIAAIIAVVLLLLPHAADHHNATLFFLVPVLLFIALIDRPVPYHPRKDQVFALNDHVRSTLFQRPPPSQA